MVEWGGRNTGGAATGLRKQIKKLRDLEDPPQRFLQPGHIVILKESEENEKRYFLFDGLIDNKEEGKATIAGQWLVAYDQLAPPIIAE